MFAATYNGPARDWEEALSLLIEGRQELIKTVLPLDREAWRIRPAHGKWCVAQIVEHLNDTDRMWTRLLAISEKLSVLFLPRKKGTVSTLENPFEVKPYKAFKLLTNPKGNARRASMVAEYEKASRSIEHRIGYLSDMRRAKLRMFSPVAGIIGITDALMLLHYHDVDHLNQIKRTLTALEEKGVRLYPKADAVSGE